MTIYLLTPQILVQKLPSFKRKLTHERQSRESLAAILIFCLT